LVAPPALEDGDDIVKPYARAHARQSNGGAQRGGCGQRGEGVQVSAGVRKPKLGCESQKAGAPGERRLLIVRGLFVKQRQACLQGFRQRRSNDSRCALSAVQGLSGRAV
jgi:hypothetical protein